jgi:hypothetical protein
LQLHIQLFFSSIKNISPFMYPGGIQSQDPQLRRWRRYH